MAVLVETQELIETVIASAVAGIGVTVIFSVAIWGAARFIEHSRSERMLAASGAVLVTTLALLATAAAVVLGIIVMSSN